MNALKSPGFAPNLRRIALPVIVALGFVAAGCGASDEEEPTPHDRTIKCLTNDFEGRHAQDTLEVPGEEFTIRVRYSTNYNAESWKITDTKAINIELGIDHGDDKKPPEVLVENLHADASVKLSKQRTNGLP